MKKILHKAETRGHANHGWLNAYHTFSFANFYDPSRMHFGVLRVLNDDTIAPGKGFGTHPHDNMEIITIPLKGELEHKDSMGNTSVIKQGEVQVMSAGTGIFHSEYNKRKDKSLELLQIWVFPDKKNIEPRYDQITLNEEKLKNNFQQILSPNAEDDGVWIHQNAWFHLGAFDTNEEAIYKWKDKNNGIYVFVIEGELSVVDQTLSKRDGLGIWEENEVSLKFKSSSRVLIMEVPMR